MEVPFFYSQLTKFGTKGAIMIGSVDKVESSRQTKALVRAEKKEAAAAEKEAKKKVAKELEAKKQSDFENDFKEDNNNTRFDDDEEFRSAATDGLVKSTNQNHLKLTNMARASLNCDVSISATAQIGTALLIDLGIVTAEDTSKIIHKSKIRRERDKVIKELHMEGLRSLKE
jgi:hypothetical protein